VAHTVEVLPAAARQLRALPEDARRRIARAIDRLAEDPRRPGVTVLHAEERIFRLRVGDYRVLYQIHDDRLIVVVVKVGHRRDVYRNL